MDTIISNREGVVLGSQWVGINKDKINMDTITSNREGVVLGSQWVGRNRAKMQTTATKQAI